MKEQIEIKVLSQEEVKSPFGHGYCYQYKLELMYNKKSYTFTYHGSINDYNKGIELDINDPLYSILSDKFCYEDYPDMQEFGEAFGYIENGVCEDMDTLLKVYKGCKKTAEALHRIFTNEELEKLHEEFQDY